MEELLKESKSEGSKVCEVRKFQSRSFGWDVIERYDGLKVDRQNDISTLALYLGDWKKLPILTSFGRKGILLRPATETACGLLSVVTVPICRLNRRCESIMREPFSLRFTNMRRALWFIFQFRRKDNRTKVI